MRNACAAYASRTPHIPLNPMLPIAIDVFSPLPEGWGLCLSCEVLMARANLDKAPYDRALDEYPPEWRADFQRLSDLVLDLAARYGSRVSIRMWDPRSLQGLFRCLRFRVRRYPTFVIAGRWKVSDLDADRVEYYIMKALANVSLEIGQVGEPSVTRDKME